MPEFWATYVHSLRGISKSLLNEAKFVALDSETTGFSFNKDRMLSLGWLVLQQGEIKAKSAQEIFIEQKHFDENTVEIHGILKGGTSTKQSEWEAVQLLLADLQGAVIIAHHALFDIKMINQVLKRNGLPKLKNPYVDTALLYRSLPSKYSSHQEGVTLDHLLKQFSIPAHDRHTALGDAYITAIAFLKMISIKKPTSMKSILHGGGQGFLARL